METENSKTHFVTVNHIYSSIDSSLYIDSKTTFVTVNRLYDTTAGKYD